MPTKVMNQAEFDALKTTLKARWNAGLALSTEDWKKVAKLVTSSSAANTYAWMSQFPAFREWVGSRQHKKVKEQAYTVKNRKFETTVDVERTDWEDDNCGHYGTLAESAGQSATDLKNDLIFQALATGFSNICYDGQYFFDTDHPVFPEADGTGVAVSVSNMQVGTGAPWVLLCTKRAPAPVYLQERIAAQFDSLTSPQSSQVYDQDVFSFGGRWRGDAAYGFWQCAFGSKAELNADNFEAAYMAMMNFRGDGGKRLGIVPDTLLVGADNLAAAEKLLKAAQNANGASNTNYQKVALVATAWM